MRVVGCHAADCCSPSTPPTMRAHAPLGDGPRRRSGAGRPSVGRCHDVGGNSAERLGEVREERVERARLAPEHRDLAVRCRARRTGPAPRRGVRHRRAAPPAAGSKVTATPAATIWRSVSRLVARKPSRSTAPTMWHTLSAWSRRQCPSSSRSTCSSASAATGTGSPRRASGMIDRRGEHEVLLEQRLAVQSVVVDRRRRRSATSSRPSRSRRSNSSVFSSTISSSSFGKPPCSVGMTCGSRYGRERREDAEPDRGRRRILARPGDLADRSPPRRAPLGRGRPPRRPTVGRESSRGCPARTARRRARPRACGSASTTSAG